MRFLERIFCTPAKTRFLFLFSQVQIKGESRSQGQGEKGKKSRELLISTEARSHGIPETKMFHGSDPAKKIISII